VRLALAALFAIVGALYMLARRFRVEPLGPAPEPDDIDWLLPWVMEPTPRGTYLTASEWRN
jgi:hypothetical protein